jgi:tetraacyldisaccharide 4'-kinase
LSGRRLLYKIEVKKIKTLPAKVISIGNLTLGGTGKTPAVIAIAQEAKKRGFKPCVLTRGYKGKAKSPCFADKNKKYLLNTHQIGDEALLMAYRIHGIPVVKGKNRFLSGVYALGKLGIDSINMFVLDDGFQHWELYRDIDILLIDATNPFGNEKLFPEGILREPLNSMERADIIVMTKADMVNEETISAIIQKVKQYNLEAPVFTASHKPTSFINASGETKTLEALNNKRVYVFAGIANPSHFKTLLKSQGADIIKFKKFRDHYNYKQRDINRIKKEAGGLEIITTEKDLVKLKGLELPENIFALRVDFSIDDSFYDILFKRMSDDTNVKK